MCLNSSLLYCCCNFHPVLHFKYLPSPLWCRILHALKLKGFICISSSSLIRTGSQNVSSPLLKGTLTRHTAVGGMTLQSKLLSQFTSAYLEKSTTHLGRILLTRLASVCFSVAYVDADPCLRLSNRCDQYRHLSLVSHTLFVPTASWQYEPKTQRTTCLRLYLNCNCSCNMTETWDGFHNDQYEFEREIEK